MCCDSPQPPAPTPLPQSCSLVLGKTVQVHRTLKEVKPHLSKLLSLHPQTAHRSSLCMSRSCPTHTCSLLPPGVRADTPGSVQPLCLGLLVPGPRVAQLLLHRENSQGPVQAPGGTATTSISLPAYPACLWGQRHTGQTGTVPARGQPGQQAEGAWAWAWAGLVVRACSACSGPRPWPGPPACSGGGGRWA